MLIGFAFGLSSSKVAAATKEISEISPGSVVSVNGVKFVKLNNNNQFVAVAPSICPNFATGMYMQDFTSAMCANAPTPSGTDYFPIGILTDRRDNKKYEVRKFADGNCWMVDNLAYGGTTEDGCLKTTFNGNTDSTPTNIFGDGTYGDCRYPYDSIATPDVNKYGYLYNWQAVMQNADAYNGNDYQPVQPVTGICPEGWYIPTGGAGGQFWALHTAIGVQATGFWQPGGNWQGSFAGHNGTQQGTWGFYWSSTQFDAHQSCRLNLSASGVATQDCNPSKNGGVSVRCLKTP